MVPKTDSRGPDWATAMPLRYVWGRWEHQSLSSSAHTRLDIESLYHRSSVMNSAPDYTGPRFRLLQIYPGTQYQPIHGALTSKPVFDAPPYIALSYSWGDITDWDEIYIGKASVPFPVSTHLWNALRRVRDEQEIVNVWVDAVCINQESLPDKAAQVQIMAQIYNTAEEVRIWLGNLSGYDGNNELEFFWLLCHQHQPWWRRLWIIQECAHAKTCPVVMVGSQSMGLQDLVWRWSLAVERSPPSYQTRLQKNLNLLCMPYNAWRTQIESNQHRLPLLQRIQQTVGHQCSDERDRIYALLSLVTENEARQIQPNYEKSYTELREDVLVVLRQSNDWDEERDHHLFSPSAPFAPRLETQIESVSHEGNETELQQLILANDIPPHTIGKYRKALQAASAEGHLGVVRLLLRSGTYTNGNGPGIKPHSEALYHASIGNHVEVVKALIAAGADVEAYTEMSEYGCALHCASVMGHMETVKVLLEAGADPNAYAERGTHGSSLYGASAGNHPEVVKVLLEAGADPNAYYPMSRHGNAFQAALAIHGFSDMVKILLEAGIDIDAAPEAKLCPSVLFGAVVKNDIEMVKMLLEAGAYVPDQNDYWTNELRAASIRGHTEILQLLRSSHKRQHSDRAAPALHLEPQKDLAVERL